MKITTRPEVAGYEIVDDIGVIAASSTHAAMFAKDWFAKIRDTFGGKVGTYSAMTKDAMRDAFTDLSNQAANANADAVVDVTFQLTNLRGGAMIVAAVTGTAVKLKKQEA